MYKKIIIILFIIILTSCLSNKQQLINNKLNNLTDILWIKHQKKINKLFKFKIYGSFIYINHYKKLYTNFFWEQKSSMNYRLLLTNFLGNIELQLYTTSFLTELIDNNGKKYINNDPQKLIYYLTGINIPIKNFYYWILGLPTINAKLIIINKKGVLENIKYIYNGKIWYLKYFYDYKNNNIILPNCIELIQDQQYLRIKINKWIINQ